MEMVSLILAIEDFFGLELPEDGSLRLGTVGDLYEWLLAQQPCRIDPALALRADQLALDRLKPALAKIIDAPPRDFVPAMDLRTLIPFYDRRRVWRELRAQLGLNLPGLSVPKWILRRLVAGSITAGLCLFPSIGSHALVIAASLGIVGLVCLVPLTVTIPPQHSTLAGLASGIATANFARLTAQGEPYTARDLWAIVVHLISKELGVPIDEIVPSSRWNEDLHVS